MCTELKKNVTSIVNLSQLHSQETCERNFSISFEGISSQTSDSFSVDVLQ
jgi:hypothetical protein